MKKYFGVAHDQGIKIVCSNNSVLRDVVVVYDEETANNLCNKLNKNVS